MSYQSAFIIQEIGEIKFNYQAPPPHVSISSLH